LLAAVMLKWNAAAEVLYPSTCTHCVSCELVDGLMLVDMYFCLLDLDNRSC
jgi:hypothetical protein